MNSSVNIKMLMRAWILSLIWRTTFTTRNWKHLLTSHPDLISDVTPLAGIIDHCIIDAKFQTKVIKIPIKPPRYVPLRKKVNNDDFRKLAANFRKLAANLANEFFDLQSENRSVEKNWTYFKDSLNDIVTKNIPHKLNKGRMHAPWFSTKSKRLTSKKEKVYIRAKKSGKIWTRDKFTRVRKQVDHAIRSAHRSHVSSVLESDQPKDFWSGDMWNQEGLIVPELNHWKWITNFSQWIRTKLKL